MGVSFHRGQMALGSVYKYQGGDGRTDKGVFVSTRIPARGLLTASSHPVQLSKYHKIWIYLPK